MRRLPAELQVDLEERAAFLEIDGGMPRLAAMVQALAELGLDGGPGGVLGELIAAGRLRADRRLESVLGELGLAGARAPCWGFAAITPAGPFYAPADIDEPTSPAVIAPASEVGLLVDLVAQPLPLGPLLTRLGAATVLGADAIEVAREAGQPLMMFGSVLSWLRSGTRGVVVVDWRRAGDDLDGVPVLRCQRSIASLAHRATRRLRPAPKILVPEPSGGMRRAA